MKTAAVIVAFALCGCSVLVMRKPVERMPAPPDCTDSRWAPAYDLVNAGASLLIASTADSLDDGMSGGLRGMFAVQGIAYALSAVYGFSRARECKDAKARWEAEVLPRMF